MDHNEKQEDRIEHMKRVFVDLDKCFALALRNQQEMSEGLLKIEKN